MSDEEYKVLLHPDVQEFLQVSDEKTERVVRDNLEKLAENPYPGSGKGDKERIVIDGEKRYRLHRDCKADTPTLEVGEDADTR